LDVLLAAFVDGGAQMLFTRLGHVGLYGALQWARDVRAACERGVEAVSSGKFDEEALQLQTVRRLLVKPLFDLIAVKGGFLVALGWVSAICVSLISSSMAGQGEPMAALTDIAWPSNTVR
jgi:hypothetical protein